MFIAYVLLFLMSLFLTPLIMILAWVLGVNLEPITTFIVVFLILFKLGMAE